LWIADCGLWIMDCGLWIADLMAGLRRSISAYVEIDAFIHYFCRFSDETIKNG